MIEKSKTNWPMILENYQSWVGTQREFCQKYQIGLAGFCKQLEKWWKRKSIPQTLPSAFVEIISPKPSTIVVSSTKSVELIIGSIQLKVHRDSDPQALRVALHVSCKLQFPENTKRCSLISPREIPGKNPGKL